MATARPETRHLDRAASDRRSPATQHRRHIHEWPAARGRRIRRLDDCAAWTNRRRHAIAGKRVGQRERTGSLRLGAAPGEGAHSPARRGGHRLPDVVQGLAIGGAEGGRHLVVAHVATEAAIEREERGNAPLVDNPRDQRARRLVRGRRGPREVVEVAPRLVQPGRPSSRRQIERLVRGVARGAHGQPLAEQRGRAVEPIT